MVSWIFNWKYKKYITLRQEHVLLAYMAAIMEGIITSRNEGDKIVDEMFVVK